MAVAKVFISRAGFSSLVKLAYLGKPAILIPLPNSHQEKNAAYFKAKNAVEVFNIKEETIDNFTIPFALKIQQLLEYEKRQTELSTNIQRLIPQDSTAKLAAVVLDILHKQI